MVSEILNCFMEREKRLLPPIFYNVFEVHVVHSYGFNAKRFLTGGHEVMSSEKDWAMVKSTPREV